MGPEMNSGSLPDKSAMAARGSPQLARGLLMQLGVSSWGRLGREEEGREQTDPQKWVEKKYLRASGDLQGYRIKGELRPAERGQRGEGSSLGPVNEAGRHCGCIE